MPRARAFNRLIGLEKPPQFGLRDETHRLTKDCVKSSPIQFTVKRRREDLTPDALDKPLDFNVAALLTNFEKAKVRQNGQYFHTPEIAISALCHGLELKRDYHCGVRRNSEVGQIFTPQMKGDRLANIRCQLVQRRRLSD